MRYFYTTLLLLFCLVPCFAQETESRLFVAPGRETFIHFPSQTLGDKYTLRVYLPQGDEVKNTRYPVIYVLGAQKDERDALAAYLKTHRAIIVRMDSPAEDLQRDAEKIIRFMAHELPVYIDTNYYTLSGADRRILAAYGTAAGPVAAALWQKPDAFRHLALFDAGGALNAVTKIPPHGRVNVTGKQGELDAAQRKLEALGAQFGTDFVLHYTPREMPAAGAVDLAYFEAAGAKLEVKKFTALPAEKELPVRAGAEVPFAVWAVLKNGMQSAYVPQNLRMSPPVLEWDATRGMLRVLSGAEAGKIKVGGAYGKRKFKAVLKLKKP